MQKNPKWRTTVAKSRPKLKLVYYSGRFWHSLSFAFSSPEHRGSPRCWLSIQIALRINFRTLQSFHYSWYSCRFGDFWIFYCKKFFGTWFSGQKISSIFDLLEPRFQSFINRSERPGRAFKTAAPVCSTVLGSCIAYHFTITCRKVKKALLSSASSL